MSQPFLEVTNLTIKTQAGKVLVDDLSFGVEKGETLAIIGESGSGKSLTCLAIMGLLDPFIMKVSGSIRVDGTELVGLREAGYRRHRGSSIGMVFQDPLTALHPFFTVGAQLVEGLRVHRRISKTEARDLSVELLERVGIENPAQRMKQYPHQFSGGMRQRVVIAMAVANRPGLLLADEPTTALDVSVQAQVLTLLRSLTDELGSAVLHVTHDLGVTRESADTVLVMHSGRVLERGRVSKVLHTPRHPYTQALLDSYPTLTTPPESTLKPADAALADLPPVDWRDPKEESA
ncbi:ABC transporter ATP-binding protein [Microbacterium sp. SSW1-49]|uniref:ABC transporter ATP-binding protein n=1 Tax=Microbacterium croceum TaxID=2851645 RepID=A0ABT0FCE2_9MICO|nr:ABC transporter ATP-binding protein [Microbacterium croceum]MCK2035718.1 ABC transporter ATP-binding protein [Microbacterium croceum]